MISTLRELTPAPFRQHAHDQNASHRIIYPHSYPDFVQSGKTDDDLLEILRKVHLAYLPEREGGEFSAF